MAVWLRGEWDGNPVTDRTVEFVASATTPATEHLMVDLSGVTYMGSPGLSCLVQLHRRQVRGHEQLHLSGVDNNRAVALVIEITGLRSLFTIGPEVDQLVAELTGPAQPP